MRITKDEERSIEDEDSNAKDEESNAKALDRDCPHIVNITPRHAGQGVNAAKLPAPASKTKALQQQE